MLQIVAIIIGLIALIKGEMTIVGKRKIRAGFARFMGVMLLLGGGIGLTGVFIEGPIGEMSGVICIGAGVIALIGMIVGLFVATPDPVPVAAPVASAKSATEQLQEAANLLEKGLITQAEYDSLKQKVLSGT